MYRPSKPRRRSWIRQPSLFTILITALVSTSAAVEPGSAAARGAAQRGYLALLEKAFLPTDFDQEVFDATWRSWPEPLRTQASKASMAEQRRMAFQRYGLTERPNDSSGKPLQYVVDSQGNWAMNCFSCHGGKVAGQVIPGLPNTHHAMQTFKEEVRATKVMLGKPLDRRDLGALLFPMGTTHGTTNAVMFGVILAASRDSDLNYKPFQSRPRLVNHDMDAPAWWHFRKRPRLYIDGMAERGHRALMQFIMVKENSPADFHQWEHDFKDIYAYLMSLTPPPYPFAINQPLAKQGQQVFERHCADCHGTYGAQGSYPDVMIPIETIGTDPVRFRALTESHRTWYQASWFAHHGKKQVVIRPSGYVAPPLDGIWATAPYLHNGSVPTLWGILNPDKRPTVWKRTEDGYDTNHVGLEAKHYAEPPEISNNRWLQRTFFDTRQPGKSASGHRFPDVLSPAEKKSVLEYLKTL